jgi:RNA polymerase sigma-70 factor (ECF subfamily)
MDRELVIRAQRGDHEAFAAIVVGFGRRLHGLAQRVLRDVDLAEDATQRALVAMWRDLPRLRDVDRFEAWSYRLVINACHTESRRERRMTQSVRLLPIDTQIEDDATGVVVNRDELDRGFRRLSIDNRAVLMLHYYLDMPVEEIATTVGIPPGTARSRLHHAIRSMRAVLEADARPAVRSAR